ncbi:hypothetical protein [Mycolicibacterium pallens]|uniref:Transmembrane protein n=1 Tax=Mycolicibacterium pallens TaxID=370524 RepID=A0ABX8VNH4_9MYCO|nr:hypothetical protein [Mycolicibacterium pallens]QYL17633.1 hypothetical protein K0O64_03400 [Mycolicibacterium pallens]
MSAVILPVNVIWKRRTYWTGWIAGAILLASYVSDHGPMPAALTAVTCLAVAALYAFYSTPFIKIGGRVRTFWISDAREDPDEPPAPADSYLERVTACSMWWNTALLSMVTGGFALATGWLAPVGIMGGALLAAPLAATGHLDRKDRFPIARGRYLPFAIVVLGSVPTLLWPVAVYFVAYYMTTPTPRDDVAHQPFLEHDS